MLNYLPLIIISSFFIILSIIFASIFFIQKKIYIKEKYIVRFIILYISIIGLIILIINPIIFFENIKQLYISKGINYILENKSLEVSLTLNVLFYWLFISWYLPRVFSKKIDVLEKINIFIISISNRYLYTIFNLIIGIILSIIVFYIYIINLLDFIGYSNINIVIIILFIYLFIIPQLLGSFFYFINNKLKLFKTITRKQSISFIKILAYIDLLFIYIVGNTPKLNSSILILAITSLFSIDMVIDKIKQYIETYLKK